MNAHWGAAVVAAYYMLKEMPFEKDVAGRMKRLIDLLIKKKARYFKPFEEEGPQKDLIKEVPKSISANMHQWRAHGHRKIFAMQAMRALIDRPDLAQPAIIRGLTKIAETVDKHVPAGRIGRSLSKPYKDEQELIDATFKNLYRYRGLRLGGVGTVPRNGVHPQGNFNHWITHTDALVRLRGLGHRELVRSGHGALKFHIARERKPPHDVVRDHVPKKTIGIDDVTSMDLWGRVESDDPSRIDSLHVAHLFKTLYAYIPLRARVSNKKMLPACDHIVLREFWPG